MDGRTDGRMIFNVPTISDGQLFTKAQKNSYVSAMLIADATKNGKGGLFIKRIALTGTVVSQRLFKSTQK